MNNINKYRFAAGMSQTEFAKKCGVYRQTAYDWENTTKALSYETMEKIAKVLGNCIPMELYGDTIFAETPKSDEDVVTILKELSKLAKDKSLKSNIEFAMEIGGETKCLEKM